MLLLYLGFSKVLCYQTLTYLRNLYNFFYTAIIAIVMSRLSLIKLLNKVLMQNFLKIVPTKSFSITEYPYKPHRFHLIKIIRPM